MVYYLQTSNNEILWMPVNNLSTERNNIDMVQFTENFDLHMEKDDVLFTSYSQAYTFDLVKPVKKHVCSYILENVGRSRRRFPGLYLPLQG